MFFFNHTTLYPVNYSVTTKKYIFTFLSLLLHFKGLADVTIIGGLLRRSGAFYIRRAIGSDKLYWAVLLEYVQTIVRVRR